MRICSPAKTLQRSLGPYPSDSNDLAVALAAKLPRLAGPRVQYWLLDGQMGSIEARALHK